jgi:protein phosphatase 1L
MKKIVISLLISLFLAPGIIAVPIKFSVVTEQNKREYQEDRSIHTSIVDEQNKKLGDFFGVYDGHGGDKASILLAEKLHVCFADILDKWKNVEKAFFGSFLYVEHEAISSFDDGSTAVACYVDDSNMLHVAWVGDSRLVLDNGFATQDHKPDRLDEKKRIEDAGGKIEFYGVPRINGLAVSRSIGDIRLKKYGHHYGHYSGYIIATPEHAQCQLTKDNAFAIMASDGLWDVVSNDAAIAMVKEAVQDGKSYDDAAHALKDEAIKRGSGDNITIMIAQFDWLQKN